MYAILTALLLSQVPGTPTPPDPYQIWPPLKYNNIHQCPAFSAGNSHCEQDVRNPNSYTCRPEHLPRMGAQYPFVRFDDHLLDFNPRTGQYHFHSRMANGSPSPYAGKVVRWFERQDFHSKHTYREIILPDQKHQNATKKATPKVSTGNKKPLLELSP